MEVNPATVDYDSLVRYRRAGINRLSIGVQSFQDEELKFLGADSYRRGSGMLFHYGEESRI